MMDCKEEFTKSFICECSKCFGKGTSEAISIILFKNLWGYDLIKKSTELTVDTINPNLWYLKQFLAIKTVKGLSDKTIARYKGDIMTFFSMIPKDVTAVDANDIRYFLAIKARDGCCKTTLNNYLLSLRSFFGTLLSEELIKKNPTTKVDRIKEDKVIKKPFSDEEIEMLRKRFKDMPRERAILEILLSTGCRIGELYKIDRKDVNGNKIIVTGKGNKQRTVYLNATSKFALNEYLETRTDDNPALFVGKKKNSCKNFQRLAIGRIEQLFRETGRDIGVDDCHPHRFRRTAATNALRNGMPIEQVSLMLGHEQLTTTQIYARSEERDIEAAHKKYVR